ncbi:unnamed protein product [Arabidopsis halleri]
MSTSSFSSRKQNKENSLELLLDKFISVITDDGRNIVGVLKGFDQATNIILDESHERVFSTKKGRKLVQVSASLEVQVN